MIKFPQIPLVQYSKCMMCYKSELNFQYRQHYRLASRTTLIENLSNCMNNYYDKTEWSFFFSQNLKIYELI